MRNIFLFIHRHFNFLLFILLQAFSIYLIVEYNRYHRAVFNSIVNKITGDVNTKFADVQQYFYLQKTNKALLEANEILYNKIKSNYSIPDSGSKSLIDSINVDSLLSYQKIKYFNARVVSNSVSSQNNYIVLDRGKLDGVKEGMGVIDLSFAMVGIVTELTDRYAVVMSLLHRDSHISGKLLKSGETGTINWEGFDPDFITLNNISKSAKIVKGDTVISSGFSTAFPKGVFIGKIETLYKETSNSNYKIKLHSMCNFRDLQYVFLIENKDQDGVKEALEKIKKQP